jgi:hypothetical protein
MRRLTRLITILAAALLAAAPASAQSKSRDVEKHPAFVADPGVLAFADEETEIIEISLRRSLLKPVAKMLAGEEPEVAALIDGLVGVNAVILNNWAGSMEKARDTFMALDDDLPDGWERIVRVRSERELTLVYIHTDANDDIDGLLVLVQEGRELIFTNLIGPVDLELVAGLEGRLDIPGLERVPDSREPVDTTGDAADETGAPA